MLEARDAQQRNDERERHIEEQEAKTQPSNQGEQSPAHRDFRLRSREFAAAALRTALGSARVLMTTRTKFHVIAPAAEVAIGGLALGHVSALVAILHWGS